MWGHVPLGQLGPHNTPQLGGTHLCWYFASFSSSQAVLPPPKPSCSVRSRPWAHRGGGSTGVGPPIPPHRVTPSHTTLSSQERVTPGICCPLPSPAPSSCASPESPPLPGDTVGDAVGVTPHPTNVPSGHPTFPAALSPPCPPICAPSPPATPPPRMPLVHGTPRLHHCVPGHSPHRRLCPHLCHP